MPCERCEACEAAITLHAGAVTRGEKYKTRYQATLNTREHNQLRLCRILSCFSVLGFRRYKAPLVRFLEAEAGYFTEEPRRQAGRWPLKLSPYAVQMFRNYLHEEKAQYLRFTGVKLPGDHSDHVVFTEMQNELRALSKPIGLSAYIAN